MEAVLNKLERIGTTIMNRAQVSGPMASDPMSSVLGDRDKRRVGGPAARPGLPDRLRDCRGEQGLR